MSNKSKSRDVMTIRIDPQLADYLSAQAEGLGLSRNQLVEKLIGALCRASAIAKDISKRAGLPKGFLSDDSLEIAVDHCDLSSIINEIVQGGDEIIWPLHEDKKKE